MKDKAQALSVLRGRRPGSDNVLNRPEKSISRRMAHGLSGTDVQQSTTIEWTCIYLLYDEDAVPKFLLS